MGKWEKSQGNAAMANGGRQEGQRINTLYLFFPFFFIILILNLSRFGSGIQVRASERCIYNYFQLYFRAVSKGEGKWEEVQRKAQLFPIHPSKSLDIHPIINNEASSSVVIIITQSILVLFLLLILDPSRRGASHVVVVFFRTTRVSLSDEAATAAVAVATASRLRLENFQQTILIRRKVKK